MDNISLFPQHPSTPFFKRVAQDKRLRPSHVALLSAIFQHSDYPSSAAFRASRRKLMHFSRIRSISTYHTCLKDLIAFGYLQYEPSWHPKHASEFRFTTLQEEDYAKS